MNKILLVEDKESLARMLEETLRAEGFETDWAPTGTEAMRRLQAGHRYAVVLTDLRLPGEDGIAVLRKSKESDPDCPVIVMTAFGTIANAVEAMRIGAYDFIQKPIDVDYLILLVRRCREHRELRFENLILREEFQKKHGFPAIIGDSPSMVSLSQQIQKVAATDSTVLLQGESGTGKELFARAIHQLSPRRLRPFVALNCAAIPDTLIENELFGHEKGAFTGAAGRQVGKFELADGGTIFLDEIGELGLGVQSKILRVLQERRFDRIGSTATVEVDIRIVCATNRTLSEAVKGGEFREDLFFRINVFPVTVPPLRERKSDIDHLTSHFLEKFAREMGKGQLSITEAARAVLREYSWPGNIRELENCIERAVILCEKGQIDVGDLNVVPDREEAETRIRQCFDLTGSLGDVSRRASDAVEKLRISDALSEARNKNDAAERLGISYRTLLNKMKDYGMGGESA